MHCNSYYSKREFWTFIEWDIFQLNIIEWGYDQLNIILWDIGIFNILYNNI